MEVINGENRIEEIRNLFKEYSMMEGAERCFITFENEMRNLPGQYARPSGELLLAIDDGMAVGCVGLRKKSEYECEIKRLFVRTEYRSKGYGKELLDAVLRCAKEKQYKLITLETLPIMQSAINLYISCGFKKTVLEDGRIYMEKNL